MSSWGRNIALSLTVAFAACGGRTIHEDGTIDSGGGTGGAQVPFGGTTGAPGGSGGGWDVRPGLGGSIGLGGHGSLGFGGYNVPYPFGGSPGLGGAPVLGGGSGGSAPVGGSGGSGGSVVMGGAAGEGPPLAGHAGQAGLAGIAGVAGWGGAAPLAGAPGWGGAPPLAGAAGIAGEGPVGGQGGGSGGAGGGTCTDAVMNGNEEDVDCGGRCPPCVVPCTCSSGPDCQSLVCVDCQCVPPECDDGVTNGDETDVDCGGTTCDPCPPGMICLMGSDCTSALCTEGVCPIATCQDGVQNDTETDVDCGGSVCSPCADGEHCLTHTDCVSSFCFISVCGGPPSCDGGLDCNGESCCTSIQVPGGSYQMGRGSETCADCLAGCPANLSCSFNEEPEHPASVSSFALDKYEVTVGRFRAFVDAGVSPPSAGSGAHPLITGSGWDSAWDASYPADQAALVSDLQSGSDCSWTDTAGANETYAVNCVTWYEAFAFCVWDGGRLPTEAEWEYVTAGGDENRLYPWGAIEPTATHANYGPSGSAVLAVGSWPLGVGRWGHRDLAGNVYEWTLDGYGVDYYSSVSTDCDDCANLGVTAQRSIRGGGWANAEFGLRAAHRDGSDADQPSPLTGFRCARDP